VILQENVVYQINFILQIVDTRHVRQYGKYIFKKATTKE